MEDRQKGKSTSSQPIREKQAIERLRFMLREKLRDLLIFDLATQTGLRLKEVVGIKVKDLVSHRIGDRIVGCIGVAVGRRIGRRVVGAVRLPIEMGGRGVAATQHGECEDRSKRQV